MEKRKKLPGLLAPLDDLEEKDCSPEWDKFRKALNDDRVLNIAVASSYGMGKTSFLKSFLEKNMIKINMKNINLLLFQILGVPINKMLKLN